ncbi:Ribokinase-like protein [Rozella allomycis CSF55]|uniref:Carbohydrate kinase PfkB domain-containing protein n=1 Tax=Rozella allomycis (strain CSF55) TaxID=988480 RepID=A0A075AXQ9_ROZAC|nr:Carbohydrate kinase PfkB domain-containing protein [Rozella allomycis CSF55]RKP19043.1 Ribokinase-like protein [Rozella allomycis CSF55]|eukprot:EPZ35032.1 Carbohydrate kinase PfkB domain-containing protein [Rozella allomycis CSF55]
MKSESRVSVIGSVNIDEFYYVNKIAAPGETVQSTKLDVRVGGKGFNQAAAVACCLIHVELFAAIGSNNYDMIYEYSKEFPFLDAHLIKIDNIETGKAFIQKSNAENCIVLLPGANVFLSPSHLSFSSASEYIILQNETSIDLKFLINMDSGLKIVYNPSPFKKVDVSDLMKVDYLFINSSEFECLIALLEIDKVNNINHSLDLIGQKLPATSIVLSLGGKGLYSLFDGRKKFYSVYPSSNVVDSTGCGDVLLGFFVGALSILDRPATREEHVQLKAWKNTKNNITDREAALLVGICAASLALEYEGCAPSISLDAVIKRLSEEKIKMEVQ